MSNVVDIGCISKLPLNPQRVLKNALHAGMTEVVICGFNADGNDYFASSHPDAGDAIYHLERAKHRLMKIIDDGTVFQMNDKKIDRVAEAICRAAANRPDCPHCEEFKFVCQMVPQFKGEAIAAIKAMKGY